VDPGAHFSFASGDSNALGAFFCNSPARRSTRPQRRAQPTAFVRGSTTHSDPSAFADLQAFLSNISKFRPVLFKDFQESFGD
jgi:hypothetical protein